MGGRAPRWRWGDPVDDLRRLLEDGGILAIPTESSYGLAAAPGNRRGVESIYAAKGRERRKPLPVVAADVEQLVALGVDRRSPALAAIAPLWPAPLSVLLPLAEPLAQPLAATAGGATLAARVPAHRRLRHLLADLGFAVTATSANRSGEPAILDPQALEPLLAGRSAAIVDDGILSGGPPSTLVDWLDGRIQILRHGAFREALLVAHSPDLPPIDETGGAAAAQRAR